MVEKVKVIHWADQSGRPPFCGVGYYGENPPTTDKAKCTCKRCLSWIEYYEKKKKR